MKPSEAAGVLGVAASFDQRTVGEADAQAWAAALRGITMVEARDAIVAHYRTETDRVKPAHIIRRVMVVRRDARADVRAIDAPRALADHPRIEQVWRTQVAAAMGQGETQAQAVQLACDYVGFQYQPGEGQAVASPGLRPAIEALTKTMKERTNERD